MPHTPGPWNAEGSVIYADAKHITESDFTTGHGDAEYYGGLLIAESVLPHNLAIIAAAPELLEALEKIVNWEHDPNGPFAWDLLDQARAAIAKARGEA